MTTQLFLAAAVLFAQTSHRPGEARQYPLRNTFVTAAETVIDTASSIDLRAADNAASGQLTQLKASRDTLAAMARDSGEEQEQTAVDAVNDMVFAITACQLQARSGAPVDRCTTQFANARTRAMDAIRHHKNGATWVEGSPTAP